MKKTKTLSQTISVRVSEDEYALIMEGAKKNNMTPSRYLAECGIENRELFIVRTRNAVRQLIELQNYIEMTYPTVWENEHFQKGVTGVWQSLYV